jgi:hypothetical protein
MTKHNLIDAMNALVQLAATCGLLAVWRKS